MQYALFLFLTLALTGFIGWGTYQTARLLRTFKPERNLLLMPAENALRLALVLACFALGRLSGVSPETLGWAPAEPGLEIAVGLAAGLVLAGAVNGLSEAALKRWGQAIYSPLVILNIMPQGRRQWLLVLLALVPAVALEELLMRSLWLGGFSPLLPAWLLLIASSLIFGGFHLPQGALGVVGTALAGLALGALFLWRDSLLAPLVAHYAVNVVQMGRATRLRPELEALLG